VAHGASVVVSGWTGGCALIMHTALLLKCVDAMAHYMLAFIMHGEFVRLTVDDVDIGSQLLTTINRQCFCVPHAYHVHGALAHGNRAAAWTCLRHAAGCMYYFWRHWTLLYSSACRDRLPHSVPLLCNLWQKRLRLVPF